MSVLTIQEKTLRSFQKQIQLNQKNHIIISPKRVLTVLPFHKNRQRSASLTVEASLIVPIFLFFVFMLWKCFLLILLQLSVAKGVTNTCKEYGMHGYLERRINQENAGQMAWVFLPFLWEAMPETELAENWAVNCTSSEDDRVLISVEYDFLCEAPLLPSWTLPVKQTFCFYPYLGVYDQDLLQEEAEETVDVVYVTRTGTVYHESLSCTYLRMNITKVSPDNIADKRNNSGGKYSECNLCKELKQNSILYITDNGTKYHYSLQCSALSRDIEEKNRSEVEGMRACSKCGTVDDMK